MNNGQIISGSGDFTVSSGVMRSKTFIERIKGGENVDWYSSGLLNNMSYGDRVLIVGHFKSVAKVLMTDTEDKYKDIHDIVLPSIVRIYRGLTDKFGQMWARNIDMEEYILHSKVLDPIEVIGMLLEHQDEYKVFADRFPNIDHEVEYLALVCNNYVIQHINQYKEYCNDPKSFDRLTRKSKIERIKEK